MARNRCNITRICRKYDGQLKRLTQIWWNENPIVLKAKNIELSGHRIGDRKEGATDKVVSEEEGATDKIVSEALRLSVHKKDANRRSRISV